jgi:hypothetical protein
MAKLWLLEQSQINDYDTFDSAVVCAADEESARRTHPYGPNADWTGPYPVWATDPSVVKVTLLGDALPSVQIGVVLASFNAG